MSQENMEVLREAYAGYQRAASGEADLATVVSGFCDPTVEWHPVQEPSPRLGREGVVQAIQGWFDTWGNVRIEPQEFIERADQVLVRVDVRGRGRKSGVETSGQFFHVFTMHDAKVTHFREFSDKSEALEAAGLSE
jgi:ketosteroid isomerase-like protein